MCLQRSSPPQTGKGHPADLGQDTISRRISNEVGLKEPKILAVKDATRSMPPKQTLDRLLKPSATDILLESESKSGDGMQPLDSNDPPGQSYVEREDGTCSILASMTRIM